MFHEFHWSRSLSRFYAICLILCLCRCSCLSMVLINSSLCADCIAELVSAQFHSCSSDVWGSFWIVVNWKAFQRRRSCTDWESAAAGEIWCFCWRDKTETSGVSSTTWQRAEGTYWLVSNSFLNLFNFNSYRFKSHAFCVALAFLQFNRHHSEQTWMLN